MGMQNDIVEDERLDGGLINKLYKMIYKVYFLYRIFINNYYIIE